jgi:hypothetical protein
MKPGRIPLSAASSPARKKSRNGTVIKRVLASVPLVSESAGLAHVLQAIQVIRHVTDKKTGEVKTGSRIFPWLRLEA